MTTKVIISQDRVYAALCDPTRHSADGCAIVPWRGNVQIITRDTEGAQLQGSRHAHLACTIGSLLSPLELKYAADAQPLGTRPLECLLGSVPTARDLARMATTPLLVTGDADSLFVYVSFPGVAANDTDEPHLLPLDPSPDSPWCTEFTAADLRTAAVIVDAGGRSHFAKVRLVRVTASKLFTNVFNSLTSSLHYDKPRQTAHWTEISRRLLQLTNDHGGDAGALELVMYQYSVGAITATPFAKHFAGNANWPLFKHIVWQNNRVKLNGHLRALTPNHDNAITFELTWEVPYVQESIFKVMRQEYEARVSEEHRPLYHVDGVSSVVDAARYKTNRATVARQVLQLTQRNATLNSVVKYGPWCRYDGTHTNSLLIDEFWQTCNFLGITEEVNALLVARQQASQ